MAPAIRLRGDEPWLDITSYGGAGLGRRLSRAQIEQIRRTVTRRLDVMVKVSRGWGEYMPAERVPNSITSAGLATSRWRALARRRSGSVIGLSKAHP